MTTAISSPFHRGEQAIQQRVGVREKIEDVGRRFIRDHMPDEHRLFYKQLPLMLMGTVDTLGRPWASIVAGQPGFISSSDPQTLHIAANFRPGDPAAENLCVGAQTGLLGIDFHARRRNRVNGRVVDREAGQITIAVDQSFGNCPMYIQARDYEMLDENQVPEDAVAQPFGEFDGEIRALLADSDSFFIASQFAEGDGHAADGVDVSHRGGKPGFVRVDDKHTLTFPDFSGNTHFNTLGNILLNPRAGLLFIDFESRDLVYLTGSAEILWDGEELEAFAGAERLVRFRLDAGRRLLGALPLRWSFREYSPVLEQTGSWEEVSATLAAKRKGNELREYLVERVVEENEVIRSFYLRPAEAQPPPCHVAGQFLPLELKPPGVDTPIRRTYTISNAPDGTQLRLSIKRESAPSPDLPPGLSSSYFHDHVTAGTRLSALNPRGCFKLDTESSRPVVLLSAGIGITPMVAMLEQLIHNAKGCGPARRIWFVHGARNGAEHAFGEHVRTLAQESATIQAHVAYSAPGPGDIEGEDYDSRGRLDIPLIQSLLPLDDYDFYLCGPAGFMETMFDGLRALNVAQDRIHYEFFGPATRLGNTSDPVAVAVALAATDVPTNPLPVLFRRSGIETSWDPSRGSLLDLAESEGLAPPFSCRSGVCHTCATEGRGEVTYAQPPMASPREGEVLICCAVPSPGNTEPLILDL